MNTRETILHCARELFMERGYNNVSLRDGADAAGIRVGNLTYHFAGGAEHTGGIYRLSSSSALRPAGDQLSF